MKLCKLQYVYNTNILYLNYKFTYRKEHKMNWTHLMNDGVVDVSYAVGGYPTKIIIDPNGVIAYNGSGTNVESYTE